MRYDEGLVIFVDDMDGAEREALQLVLLLVLFVVDEVADLDLLLPCRGVLVLVPLIRFRGLT